LAAGEIEVARAAVEELEAMASRSESVWDRASAAHARGLFELAGAGGGDGQRRDGGGASGGVAAAVGHLSRARRAWATLDAPYELATTGALLGKALALDGDLAGARLELDAAREIFARIGADTDRARCEEEIDALGGATAS